MGNLGKTNERLNQYAKTMGRVDHEIRGQIKGQICKLEKRKLDRGRLGVRVGRSLRIHRLS